MPKIPASTDSLPANGFVLPTDTSNLWPVAVITGTGLDGMPPPNILLRTGLQAFLWDSMVEV